VTILHKSNVKDTFEFYNVGYVLVKLYHE